MGLRDCQAGKLRQLVQFDAFQLLDNGFVPCVVSMYLLKHFAMLFYFCRNNHAAATKMERETWNVHTGISCLTEMCLTKILSVPLSLFDL